MSNAGVKRLPQTFQEVETWVSRCGGNYRKSNRGRRVTIEQREFVVQRRALRTFAERAQTSPANLFAGFVLDYFSFCDLHFDSHMFGFRMQFLETKSLSVLLVFADYLEESGNDRAAVIRQLVEALPLHDPSVPENLP